MSWCLAEWKTELVIIWQWRSVGGKLGWYIKWAVGSVKSFWGNGLGWPNKFLGSY